MLRKWLKAGVMEKHVFHTTDDGTPQGGIISPVLANIALDGLDAVLRERFPKTPDASLRAKVNLVRYADDFIITGRSKELLEKEVKPLVEQFLKERGLELSREKTAITHIEDGFDFLGQNVRKYDGKLLVKPSRKNVKSFLSRVRKDIHDNLHTTAGKLILRLYPLIRGWAMYHRYVVSKESYSAVDSGIFKALWTWATRRHPKKGRRWIKERYFHIHLHRSWVFTGIVTGADGASKAVRLFPASSVPIQRHVKIREEANPYDPTWATYFEARSRRGQSKLDHR